jgi:hypothetical protein
MLGTSSALWTAGIAWNQKFTGSTPYGNDQHPYLIWNLYRTNSDGRLEQIGRSGVKHAWLTTNGSCLDSTAEHDSHILGRGCLDTYGTGNNDTSSDLGPRSEIVPATGIWGRCGSIYDPGCHGSQTASPNGSYDQRMIVKEQQISPTVNPGASYLFESWYVAREDVNIYNSMATRSGAPSYSSTWNPGGDAVGYSDTNALPAAATSSAPPSTAGSIRPIRARWSATRNWPCTKATPSSPSRSRISATAPGATTTR